MYNSTFQVSYRRKVYEEVATLAYQRMNKEAFKWLPDWIVSVTGGNDAKEDIFSDLDYAAELCSAALGMEPSRYLDILADKTPLEQTNDPAAPMVCVLTPCVTSALRLRTPLPVSPPVPTTLSSWMPLAVRPSIPALVPPAEPA